MTKNDINSPRGNTNNMTTKNDINSPRGNTNHMKIKNYINSKKGIQIIWRPKMI